MRGDIWVFLFLFGLMLFSRFPGTYFSGDGARVDDEGDYFFMGRIDDVLNVSGHRIGTAEVESTPVADPSVVDALVKGRVI